MADDRKALPVSRRRMLGWLAASGLAALLPGRAKAGPQPLYHCLQLLGRPASPPEVAAPYIGLHAAADPDIHPAEHCLFAELRPSLIKILSYHSGPDIAWLTRLHPNARWLMRVFLHFGGRPIGPEQFLVDTANDVDRALDILGEREVVVELHNEPNLAAEGWGTAWADGRAFNTWFLDVLARFRARWPERRYLYPALSPGEPIAGVRADPWAFAAASYPAIAAADGLGVHLYWSADYSLDRALAGLDRWHALYPDKPLWVTEASYNQPGLAPAERARHYRRLIAAVRKRPYVQGLAFFVASASNPDFAAETWLGKGIAPILGRRQAP